MNIIKLFEKTLFKYNVLKAINELKQEQWITVKGNHILIKEGQTKDEAIKEFLKNKKEDKKLKDIPTDSNGYSLKLKRIQRPSANMAYALSKGFYPIDAIMITLSKNTKEGKKLQKMLDDNLTIKSNFKLKFLYKKEEDNDYIFDYKTGEMIRSNKPMYFDTLEKLNEFKEKNKDKMNFEEYEEVKEWHHYYGGSKSYIVDINKLKELGFNIDTSAAIKQFKI